MSKADTEGTQKAAIEWGGSIEVFADADLGKARAEYIQGVLKNSGSGLGAEYDYLLGPVLLRVTGNLSPSKVQDYERALGWRCHQSRVPTSRPNQIHSLDGDGWNPRGG
jgi:hypothetical protein